MAGGAFVGPQPRRRAYGPDVRDQQHGRAALTLHHVAFLGNARPLNQGGFKLNVWTAKVLHSCRFYFWQPYEPSRDEFRRNADESREQAGRCHNPLDKERWLKIAEHWLKMALEAQANDAGRT